MIRRLIASLVVSASVAFLPRAFAGDDPSPAAPKTKTFKLADPDTKAVRGTEVVPKPREATILKQWKLNMPGPTAHGVTVYVTEVQLWSDGRMRFLLSFWNRSNEGQTFYFDFEEMTVADAASNAYPQVNRKIVSGNRGPIYMRTIPRDQRFNTWVDYKAPEVPNTTFKICVMLEGRYDHRADAFKPFLITLNEPLFLNNGVFQVEKPGHEKGVEVPEVLAGEEGNPPAVAAGGTVSPMTRGGKAPVTPPQPSAGSSPREIEELQTKFRALSEEGRWLEGNLFTTQGGYHERVKIVFKKRGWGEFVEATILSLSNAQRQYELHGAFFEDLRSSTGLALKLRDNSNGKIEYTLKLEGTTLAGTDTLGSCHISFLVRK